MDNLKIIKIRENCKHNINEYNKNKYNELRLQKEIINLL